MGDEAHSDRFLGLLQGHRRILFKIAGAYGRSEADRQDLAQDIVVELWRSFGRYDEERPFATWMYRIALNVAISHHRSERRRRRDLVDDGEAVIELAAADPERAAIVLLYLEGERHDAIGAVLGMSASNVGTRIGRIKERLRRDRRAAAV